LISSSFGKYRIKKWLGGGAFGDVYLVTDTLIEKDFALKVSRLRKKDIQLLKEEARLLAGLNHPNIVRFYNVDEIDGKLVLIMEYIPGSSLREILEKGRLQISTAIDIILKVLAGLDYAHSKGVIHRDLKPENVLVEGENVKITDFGLAKFIREGSLSASMAGTPVYMAPEAWSGKYSALTDIYSVGVILYEALTGINPFLDESVEKVREKVMKGIKIPPSSHNPSIPKELDDAVMRAISPDVSRRPHSASFFSSLLTSFSTSHPFVPSTKVVEEMDGVILTPAQEEIVKSPEKRIFLLGSAGTGKTTVLLHRVAWLLKKGTKAHDIIILCFTRKAVNDVSSRLQSFVGAEGREIFIDTIHGFCEKILRAEGEKMGISPDFKIIDPLKEKGIYFSLKVKFGEKINYLFEQLSLARASGMTPDHPDLKTYLREFYLYYEHLLKEHNAMDFDGLLINANKLLEEEVMESYRERFEHILVDEFQDFNPVQYEIVKKLVGENTGVFITGDDLQSIYGWRGAKRELMRRAISEITDMKVFKLTASFRLPESHIKIARNLMSRTKKADEFLSEFPSSSMKEKEGKVELYKAGSVKEEADFVCMKIREGIERNKRNFSDFAVLMRAAHYSREFEEVFHTKGIPYTFVGMKGFYFREEVKNMVDLLHALCRRDVAALAEILNWMVRSKKARFIVCEGELLVDGEKNPAHFEKTLKFINEVMKSPDEWAPCDLIESIIKVSKFEERMKRGGPKGAHVLENINELISSAKRFGKGEVDIFVQHAKLLEDLEVIDWKKNSVKMLTVHSAKGLEFPVVFVVGLFENMFPLVRSIRSSEEIEEERRLLYVAITRSTEELYLSFPMTYRYSPAKPSRYLLDMAGM